KTEMLDRAFGDASVSLPEGIEPTSQSWPNHWSKEVLDDDEFLDKWSAWQATLPAEWNDPDH
ncbi:MAG: hypothetical protein AAF252_07100, partial [Pseudomonadota bacterium]